MIAGPAIFKWRQTEPGRILYACRWQLGSALSLRDDGELLEEERGASPVGHMLRANERLTRNPFWGIARGQVGQHPATALTPPLGRKTPYARMWRTESAGPSHFHA